MKVSRTLQPDITRYLFLHLKPPQSSSGRGIGDHAAGAHDFGQITARDHSGWPQLKIGVSPGADSQAKWLIVDATLEASGAPIHELDGTLGLDGGHCRVHILRHHIS